MNYDEIKEQLSESLQTWLRLSPEWASIVMAVLAVVLALIVALLCDRIFRVVVRMLLPRLLRPVPKEKREPWEQALKNQYVPKRGAHVLAALAFYYLLPFAFGDYPEILRVAQNLIEGYLIVVAVITINAILRASGQVWNERETDTQLPIQFAVQALQLVVWVVGTILAIAAVFDQSVGVLLSGLAGMTAIVLLIFRDSILGFIAGIQLASNDMLRIGDIIEVPQHGSNGTVEQIGLTTVVVRNFDKSISNIPSYALFSEGFKNWRGMRESGVRRMLRSVQIDTHDVQFLNQAILKRVRGIPLMQSWLEQYQTDDTQTNVGLLRIYIEEYLRQHPKIRKDMTLTVRQLPSAGNGLPLEIYAFSSVIDMVPFEEIQSEIIDHVMAIVPEFGLKLYQAPVVGGQAA